ncbi:unnamed protein product [Agarophyton chilense]
MLWPGLFSDFLTIFDASEKSKTHTVTLQSFRNVEYRFLIDDVPIILCDGCGALQKLSAQVSSDNTLPPSKEDAASPFLKCSACSFPTPFGHFRTLLGLPNCGPHLSPPLALAILVEAIGSEVSLDITHEALHAWIRDKKCRTEGLHVLLGAIGARQEQLCLPQPNSCDNNEASVVLENQRSIYHNALQAESYLEKKLSPEMFPKLPFSVSDLYQITDRDDDGAQAAERAIQVLDEANKTWKEFGASPQNNHFAFKVSDLAKKFHVAQIQARIHNHSSFALSARKPCIQKQSSS